MTDPTIRIACAADITYAPYSAVMLHSLYQQAGGAPVAVHYLCPPGFSRAARDVLQRAARTAGAELRFHEVPDGAVADLPAMGKTSRVPWYRILLPELLPEHARALYLDADTLIVDRIEPLWRTPLQGHPLGAVRNFNIRELGDHPRRLGLPDASHYFNSGVLLMDLAEMRRIRCAERVLEFARRERTLLRYWDNDALNAVLWSAYRQLDPRWNCQNSLFFEKHRAPDPAENAARLNPAILHFEGGALAKPWHYLSRHPWKQHYEQAMAATPWPGISMLDRTPATVLIRSLPARWQLPAYRRLGRLRVLLKQLLPRSGRDGRSPRT